MMGPRRRRVGAVFEMPAGFSRWASILVSGIVFLGAAISFLPADAANGLSVAASRHESRVTELYFVNATQIQLSHTGNSRVLPLAFAIRDLEGQDTTYTYRISFTDQQGTVIIGEGSIALMNQQSQIVTPTVTVPAGNSQGLVQITLLGRNETISYWLERTA